MTLSKSKAPDGVEKNQGLSTEADADTKATQSDGDGKNSPDLTEETNASEQTEEHEVSTDAQDAVTAEESAQGDTDTDTDTDTARGAGARGPFQFADHHTATDPSQRR